MHTALCMEGCGHANGELVETTNAYLKDTMHGASYMLGINYVQHLDLRIRWLNQASRADIASNLCRALERQRDNLAQSSKDIMKEVASIATASGISSEAAGVEYHLLSENGRIFHQSIESSAPPLDNSALVAWPIVAFWNRMLRVGVELRDGVYQPSLNVDDEVALHLPGYRCVPHEKIRDGDWFIDWEFGRDGVRIVKAVGEGLVAWMLPALEYVLQRGLALHVVNQVAVYEEAALAFSKEEDADRGRNDAAYRILSAARENLASGLQNLMQRIVQPLLDTAMTFIEAQNCAGWVDVCNSAQYKNFKMQLETMRGWSAPTFTESTSSKTNGLSLSGLESLLAFVPLDYSSSDALVDSAGSTARYCLHLFRYAYEKNSIIHLHF